MTVIIPIGISGCGKTTYGNKIISKFKNFDLVCPDDIREELGNINEQANNDKVFSIANKRLRESLENGRSVYFSATNLTKKNRKIVMEAAKDYSADIIAVIFCTSYRPDICEDRVRKNLENGVNRSNTLVKDDKGKTVVQRQFEKFREQMLNYKDLEKELSEYSSNYRIKSLECDPS